MSNTGAAAGSASLKPNQKKKKRKGRGGLIAVVVVLLLVGAFAALLYFNLYNIRDMVFDWLAGVPVIGSLIPESEDGARAPRVSAAELQSRVDLLQRQVDSLTRDRDIVRDENEGLKRENDRLRGFEAQQEQIKRDTEALVNQIIADDPLAFWRLYQQIDPDTAEERAREASGAAQQAREVREYLSMIGLMDTKSAAAAMDELMDNDANIVAAIMNSLTTDQAATILDGMELGKRAALIRLMYPEGL